MPLPICLEIPELGDPPVITLPGGVSIQQFNLMEAIQPALTPLMPVFDIIDTVVAVFNCVKAIPDSLGPPPDPTALAACIPELAEKVSKLLKLIPQLSLPSTIIGIITCGQPSRISDRVPSKSNSTARKRPRGRSGRSTSSSSAGADIRHCPHRGKGWRPAAGKTGKLDASRPALIRYS